MKETLKLRLTEFVEQETLDEKSKKTIVDYKNAFAY